MVLGCAIAVASLTTARSSAAYCRTAVCTNSTNQKVAGTLCTPADPLDCGLPLAWPGRCIGYGIDAQGSSQIAFATIESAVETAFSAWQEANCAGETPGIRAEYQGPVDCSSVQYNQVGGNANVITFRDDVWPHDNTGNTLGLTTVTYNLDSGQIYDADMEINSTASVKLSTGNDEVEYDLLSILTHEAGHFLGLAHSPLAPATMYAEYIPGDTHLRDLDPDDLAGICAIYPANPGGVCDATPRHGFDESCFGAQDEGCTCALVGQNEAPGDSRSPLGWLLLSALAIIQRRRSGAARTATAPALKHHA
ncbi:MAG: matrixin family metalloprotease [Polyangiaceae bacterium]